MGGDGAQRHTIQSDEIRGISQPGSNWRQISIKYKAHDEALMMTVVSSNP